MTIAVNRKPLQKKRGGGVLITCRHSGIPCSLFSKKGCHQKMKSELPLQKNCTAVQTMCCKIIVLIKTYETEFTKLRRHNYSNATFATFKTNSFNTSMFVLCSNISEAQFLVFSTAAPLYCVCFHI
jgi:hypothetical protein